MKQIILGDIHGRTIWKDVVAKHPEADRFIWIGDYLDTHEDITGGQQLENLADICEFKKQNNDKVILLIGNHDHHYWPGVGNSGTSGYQGKMASSFEYLLERNKALFQMCFKDQNDVIYSHAGLSKTFIEKNNLYNTDDVNELFFHQPLKFCFSELDLSGYGQHKSQSCIWIRPESLFSDKWGGLQVVGHTQVEKINHPPKSERRGFYLIDCLPKQYLSCTDGEFKIETMQ